MAKMTTYEVRGTVFRQFSIKIRAMSAEAAKTFVCRMSVSAILAQEALQLDTEVDITTLQAEESR